MTGRTLSHYRIAEEISRGGMGVVYRAVDVRLNRDVALKVLPEELTNDPERKRRFIQEAQAASALEHPHIAVIHEVDEVDGVSFIAMELIRGDKLSDVLSHQRPSIGRALELATEVASGLARAHERGFVHRDLKPANVMVTDEGHAKIIDFGIAKLIEGLSANTAAATLSAGDTAEGVVLGTAAYMSPEQARGEKVDHRSDIFAFGVLLHEMLSGQPPFQGRSTLDTASAILHQPAPRLPSLGPSVSAEATADIQRILDKCLAKEPGDRYQGMKDVVVDLRAARRRLESTTQAAVPGVAPTLPRWLAPAAATMVVVAAIAAILIRVSGGDGTDTSAGTRMATSDKPSVAVLYFDNTTGSPELDWLRTGITEMVVTDLSQSQDLEVLATDQLYEVMAQLKRADDRVTSPDVIRAVAERTGVSSVIVGSYVKAGDAIRINVRLQEASTGRILSSERVDGPSESSLFTMVDDLTRRIHARFQTLRSGMAGAPGLLRAPGGEPNAGLDRGLGDVTTTSIEAYKLYAEGINLHDRYRETEAADLFEKATRIDPSFAMAFAKLSVVHSNLGRYAERDKYAALALKHADRLTLRERYYIEGFYYSTLPDGDARSLEAYKKCIALDPGHYGCRNNLANQYADREQRAEAIAEFEELLRRGSTNPTTTGNLTISYRALGDFAKARAAVERFLSRNPESGAGHVYAGDAHVTAEDYAPALASYAKAAALDPTLQSAAIGRLVANILREDWAAADDTIKAMRAATDPNTRWLGQMVGANAQLFHGKGRDALSLIDDARSTFSRPGIRSAQAHGRASMVLLDLSQPAAALSRAQQALADAQGTTVQAVALVRLAETQAALGRRADAEVTLGRLIKELDPVGNKADTRTVAHTRGVVALRSGDYTAALDHLKAAQSVLSVRGAFVGAPNPHVPIWYALAQAYLGAGDDSQALEWFRRITGIGYERLSAPVEYVRSFYALGQLLERRGDRAGARDAYRRFVGYWKDGDLDRAQVADAQAEIATLPGAR